MKHKRKSGKKKALVIVSAALLLAGGTMMIVPVVQENKSMREEAEAYNELLSEVTADTKEVLESSKTEIPVLLPDATERELRAADRAHEKVIHPPGTDKPSAPMETDDTPLPTPAPASPAIMMERDQESTENPSREPTAVPEPAEALIGQFTGVNLTACKEKNVDFVAWLHIPGTHVNYPVVLTDNVDYSLTHDFTGKNSKLGTLFSLGKTDYQTPGRNIAIYGHHITNESGGQKMFRPLLSYKDQSFYEQNSVIYLDSLYHSGAYRIFAVINLVSGEWDASRASFAGDEDFSSFVQMAQAQSLYDTGIEIDPNDRILTLITCDRSYAAEEGRLIVMAVEQ